MRSRASLRTRATVVATLVFGLVLGVGGVLLVRTLEARLVDASDGLARARVSDLLAAARDGRLPRPVPDTGEDGVAQVVGADGRVLAASSNVAGRAPVADLAPGASYEVATVRAPDDAETETYRIWAGSGPAPGGAVTAYVGTSVEAVSEASGALRRALWLGVPPAVALLALATWLVLGRVLGRLDRIRAEVDTITDERLHTRVADDGADDEVGRLAATMNAMLARLEAAARRQRDFVADVSHDLQGPLTAQRVSLELALSGSRGGGANDPAPAGEALRDALISTEQMERLVRDLLVLAAADDGAPAAAVPIDVDGIVLEEAARARAGARVRLDTAGVSAAPAVADPDDVRRVVRNLLDNAVAHAALRVTLEVGLVDGGARVDVVDDGPGVPPPDREAIFERFHRGDGARSGGGTGLGLAIARTLAERSGGTLGLVDAATETRFRLVLPGV